jgi:DNA replication protein DnaC
MFMNQIQTRMNQLRLHGMNIRWQALVETRKHNELSLGEGLELLLQSEEEQRNNNRFERLRKQARFRYQASIAELNYDPARGLNNGQIADMATGQYISKGESVLITGATGCGKSFLASALGHQACSQGYKVRYFNMQKLMIKTKMSRIDGSAIKFFNQLSKTDLLILDDFGLMHLEKQQQLDLLEIIEDRHTCSALIIASQLPVANWYHIIGEETIADAILDRLVHTSHRIELKGESLRKIM